MNSLKLNMVYIKKYIEQCIYQCIDFVFPNTLFPQRAWSLFLKRCQALFLRMSTLTILSVLIILAGCSPLKRREELHINLGADPGTLNPQETTMLTTMFILRNIGDGLVRIGPDGQALPALAEKIEQLDEGKRYRFILRETFWSNGNPVEAEDFAQSWRMILQKKVPAPLAEQLFVIKGATDIYAGKEPIESLGIEILSSKELLITLEEANPYFLHMLAVPIFFPMPADIKHVDAPYFISCGPFTLKKWRRGEEIILEKNPMYWDKESVILPGIKISMISDPQTQLELFEKGELDWCGAPTLPLPEEAETYLDQLGRLSRSAEAKTLMLVFNTRSGITSNQKIRRALSLALNRRELVNNHIISGAPAFALVPPSLMHKPQRGHFEENIKLAKQLWREGLNELHLDPSKPPKLVFSHVAAENFKRKAQALQSQWKEYLGVNVELCAYERQVHVQKMQLGDFNIGHMRWGADYPDPLNFLALFHRRDSGRNHPGWENSSYRHQIDLLVRTKEIKERDAIVERAEAILAREMPIAPIVHTQTPFMMNPRLRGYYFDALGFLDLKQAYFEETQKQV